MVVYVKELFIVVMGTRLARGPVNKVACQESNLLCCQHRPEANEVVKLTTGSDDQVDRFT